MGIQYQMKCNNCGKEFYVNIGGGIDFYLLHCDKCGKEKRLPLAKVTEKIILGEMMADDPEKQIEMIAGQCDECDGCFKLDAIGRCPECHSDDYNEVVEGNNVIRTHYD